MSAPEVSIVIPSCNHARFLPERLASILAQTMPRYEAIFLDDGSTDGSYEVARGLVGADPRFRFLRAAPPTGNPFAAWRLGLGHARSEIIWIAESDDACEPGFLENLLPLLRGDPGMGIAYCQSLEIDDQSRLVRDLVSHTDVLDTQRWRNDYVAQGIEECRRALLYCNSIPNASACLFSRRALSAAMDAAAGFTLCGDWAVYVHILSSGWRIGYRAATYNRYRKHMSSQRAVLSGDAREVKEMLRVKHRLKDILAPSPEEIAMSSTLTLRRLIDLASQLSAGEASRWFDNGQLWSALLDFDPGFAAMLVGMAPNRWLRLEIFPETDGGFQEKSKHGLHYGPNVVTRLSQEAPAGRLRIDPCCTPGLVRVIAVNIVDSATGEALAVYNGRGCRSIELAGTCLAVGCDEHGLLLYAYDNDPIMLFPYVGHPGCRVRIEVTLIGYSLVAAMTHNS